MAYLDCRTLTEHHGGDHTIFIGEVIEAKELSDNPPLLFYTLPGPLQQRQYTHRRQSQSRHIPPKIL